MCIRLIKLPKFSKVRGSKCVYERNIYNKYPQQLEICTYTNQIGNECSGNMHNENNSYVSLINSGTAKILPVLAFDQNYWWQQWSISFLKDHQFHSDLLLLRRTYERRRYEPLQQPRLVVYNRKWGQSIHVDGHWRNHIQGPTIKKKNKEANKFYAIQKNILLSTNIFIRWAMVPGKLTAWKSAAS